MAKIVSASRLGAVLQCPKQAKLKEQSEKGSPPGELALIGILVHRVLEKTGERLAGNMANVDELLQTLLAVKKRARPPIVKRAREILEGCAPMDFTNSDGFEVRFKDLEVGDYKGRGIIDRIDMRDLHNGGAAIEVTDYKTGVVITRDDLQRMPQTVMYLAHAVELLGHEPGPNDYVSMVYDYVSAGIKIRIDYDALEVEEGLARASELYKAFEGTDLQDCEETPGPSCEWCNHTEECSAFAKVVDEPMAYPRWHGLDLPELVGRRYQISQDARLLELALKQLNKEILGRLVEGKFKDDDYTATATSRASTTYSPTLIIHLAAHLGLDVTDLVRQVAKLNSTKLKALAKGDEEAKKLLALHASTGRGSEFLIVKARQGLF